jgi:hypothetical protein
MPAGIALLLGLAVAASLLPGPPADVRAFAVSDSAEALDTDPNFNSAGLLWGSGLDVDRFAPAAQAEMEVSSDPAPDIEGSGRYGWRAVEPAQEALAASDAAAASEGAIFLADGTMRPPAAIDISIADGRAHVSIHVVQRGDNARCPGLLHVLERDRVVRAVPAPRLLQADGGAGDMLIVTPTH